MIGDSGMGPMWAMMNLVAVLFLAAVAVIIWAVVRLAQAGRPDAASSRNLARLILDERYARGEIDDEEYATRRRVLG